MRRLLIRPGAIGDCILALPAMEFLKADYTEVWVPSAVAPLVRFAERTRGLASTGIDLLGLPGVEPPAPLIRELGSFDSIVSWYGTRREEFRAALAAFGAVFHEALPPTGVAGMHCADFFCRQVGAPTPAFPRIAVCPRARPGTLAIHPFSGSGRKNWPLERYQALERAWIGKRDGVVEWCAGPEEPLDGARRFDNLYDLAEWLAGARVYVGNDSGVTHLAAAAGAPVVALFGPTDPAIWAPRGPRVRVVCGDLKESTVESVLDAITSLL